ncbi:MAG TPA: PEP-CTERM sorting domain-containing protein [Vicinamibacterales bacterium]|nr:PEP-CTERM sorting domain-containing protein [Vicinamibacterales bacterium]
MACASAAQASTNDDRVMVPEPGAMLLVGTGLLLAARRLRKTS